MANIDVYLEAEKRGILPDDKRAVLDEARRRGLIPDGAGMPPAPDPTQPMQLGGMTVPPPPPVEKGFGGRVAERFDERLLNIRDIDRASEGGGQTEFERLLQRGGQGAAFGGDAILEAMKSVGSGISAITPDVIEEPIKEAARYGVDSVMDTSAGRALASTTGDAVQGYADFAEENPRAARNVEAVLNVGASGLPFARVGGQSGATALESLAKTGGRGVGQVASSAGGLMLPRVDSGLSDVARLAQSYDIPISAAQISTSPAKRTFEKFSKDLPLSGADAFRDRQLSAFNRGILRAVGGEGDKITPEVMDKLFTKVGAEFDSLGKGKTFSLKDEFINSIARIEDEAVGIANTDAQKNFHSVLDGVLSEVGRDGSISGERLAHQRSRINALARKTSNPDTRELLHDLENALIDTMTSGDDVARQAFSDTKQKYKNLLAIEPLAQKAKGGNISPSLLRNRVARIYGRQFTRGKAGEIGDLARIGHELLPEVGGSDTASKLLYTGAAAGSGLANLPITATALIGNRGYQSAINRNQALVRLALERDAAKRAVAQ